MTSRDRLYMCVGNDMFLRLNTILFHWFRAAEHARTFGDLHMRPMDKGVVTYTVQRMQGCTSRTRSTLEFHTHLCLLGCLRGTHLPCAVLRHTVDEQTIGYASNVQKCTNAFLPSGCYMLRACMSHMLVITNCQQSWGA